MSLGFGDQSSSSGNKTAAGNQPDTAYLDLTRKLIRPERTMEFPTGNHHSNVSAVLSGRVFFCRDARPDTLCLANFRCAFGTSFRTHRSPVATRNFSRRWFRESTATMFVSCLSGWLPREIFIVLFWGNHMPPEYSPVNQRAGTARWSLRTATIVIAAR